MPEDRKQPPSLFISYRNPDIHRRSDQFNTNTAFMLCDVLEAAGFDVNLDRRCVRPGKDFRYWIEKAIQKADVVLIIVGSNWISQFQQRQESESDDFVLWEIQFALSLNKKIIPILIDNAEMPSRKDLPHAIRKLAYLNALDFRGNDYIKLRDQIEKLMAEIPQRRRPIWRKLFNIISSA